MYLKHNFLFVHFFFLWIPFLSAQKTNLLLEEGRSICNKSKNEIFCKAVDFYIAKEYDSCYAYSSSSLMMANTIKEKDFFNCIQGYSAFIKGLHKKALLSVSSISGSKNYSQIKNYLLGNIYLNLKDYNKARENIDKWIQRDSTSSRPVKKVMYHNLALCYIHNKDYIKAKENFANESKLIDVKDTLALIRFKMDLANVYYNEYLDDDAIPLFEEAYKLAKNFSNVELKQNSSLNMAVVERNRKRYKESVGYYREFIKWKDSLFNRDKIWELTEKDKQLAVAQKENEIALQDEKIKRQRVVQHSLIAGASGLLLFLGFLAFLYKKLKNKNALITQQKEDLNIANKTKNYLFSVVSHDLRSPMNTIQYQHEQLKKYIDKNDIDGVKEANNTAIAVTKSTSHLLNNVLHWSLEQSNQLLFNQGEHALKPLIEHILFDYSTLMEAKEITISSEVQNQLVKIDKESVKIVIRNLIDNAIKYMNGKGSIKISAGKETEEFSYIKIQDTGIGISKERLEKINALTDLSIDKIDRSEGVGLGLILCQTLIKKNNGVLTFDSELGKGTTVKILLQRV